MRIHGSLFKCHLAKHKKKVGGPMPKPGGGVMGNLPVVETIGRTRVKFLPDVWEDFLVLR